MQNAFRWAGSVGVAVRRVAVGGSAVCRVAVRRVAVLGSIALMTLVAHPALAQDRIGELEQALRSEDFRVRTQAALALGASEDGRAVNPLCGALVDSNTTVRAAAASAIGRLQLGGQQCLEERLNVEPSEDVKGVIQRAIERLKEKQGSGVDDSTKYYIAIGETANETNRSKESVDSEVRKHLGKAVLRLPGYAIAPPGESSEQATKVKNDHPSLRAYLLLPKLELAYVAGTLKITLELTLLSYPDRSFIGTMSRKLSMPDTPAGDTSSENDLIEMASDQLAPDLARTLSSL
jgi:hypothetical protein